MNIRFVERNEVSQNENLLRAYKEVEIAKLTVEWITEEAALQLSQNDKCMYVCDPFEGPAFEHIKTLGCRIVGPQCVLSCLSLRHPIPKTDHPVYSIAMRNLVVSFSNIEKKTREKLYTYVEWMGGTVLRNFTGVVTHLVAGEVGSKKYHVAVSLNKSVMLPEWVYAVWKAGKQCHVNATDPEFHCYNCPIFKGCIICVTGLESQDRKDVKRLTEENGGRYTGELIFNECTHLIVSTPKGQKYDFARRGKIHCISIKWFKESLSTGACQDENLYNVEPSTSEETWASTPNRKSPNSRLSTRIADVSAIPHYNEAKIDETMMTTMNTTTMNTTTMNTTTMDMTINNMTTVNMDVKGQDPLSNLDLFNPPEDFLDACKIYLSGFSGSRLEKVRKIINIGGGTRFSQFTENVTHVIVETGTEDHIQLVMSSDFRPEVVTEEWLVECFKQGSKVSEQPYICLDVPTTHVVSPQKPVKNVPDKQSTKQKNRPKKKELEDDNEESVMMQYLNTETQDFSRIDTPELDVTKKQEIDEHNVMNEMEKDAENDDEDATQIDQEIAAEDEDFKGIFFGKMFSIIGFLEDQEEIFEEWITSEGGIVIATSDSPEVDYQIVPITGSLAHTTVRNVATNCWLQQCVESHELHELSSNPLFLPVTLDLSKTPLKGCVISISQYQGVERDCILHLVELMGATCQEHFVWKSMKLEANTHLLLRDPEGSKYDAAIKWKIPTVGKRWLLECAKQGKRVAEDKFLVDYQGHDSTLLSNSVTHGNHEVEEAKTIDNLPQNEAGEDETVEIQAADEENDQEVEEAEEQQEEDEEEDEVIIQNVNRIESAFADEQIDTNKPVTSKSPVAVTIHTEELFEQDSKEGILSDSKQTITKSISENMSVDVQFSNPRPVSRRQSELQKASTTSEDTPTKFLAPGYRPKFDIAAVLASPETPPSQKKTRHVRKSSVSLNDLLRINLKQAIENSEVKYSDDNVFEESAVNSQALMHGVIICVSMKLSKKLTVYNQIAMELGADFRWTYDPSCTHFIYQGIAKDSSKELKLAKEQNKYIVSPHWLFACQEENAYLQPSLYPHTYNPKMSLTVSKTPVRSTRKTIATTPVPVNAKSTVAAPAVVNTKSTVVAAPIVVNTKSTIATTTVPVNTRTVAATPAARAIPTNKQPDDEVTSSASKVEHSVTGQELTMMKDTVTEEELMMFDAMEKQEEHNLQQNEGMVEKTEEEKELEKEGSLEEREDFQKQMEQLMTLAMPTKGGKRRSRRLNSNTSATNMNTSAGSVSEERVNSSGSSHRARSKMSSIAENPEAKSNKAEVPIEASQNIQITWDDPAGREVRKEIMAQLQRSSSPTQQHQPSFATEDLQNESNNTTLRDLMEAQEMLTKEVENEDRMLEEQAFKAPPIRLPPARPAVAPAPLTEKQEKEIQKEKPPPIFLLSSMTPQEKMDYAALVEQLGGVVKEAKYFDESATHLVVGMPSRNEKYLSAMAMGKWLLSKSYLEACREANHFVEEDIHEWGSAMNLSTLPDQVAKLAKAAPRWRKKIEEERNKSASGIRSGAFHSWKILLGVSHKKEDGFKRLLQAGGAKILQVRPPFNHCHYEEATHAFITDDAASQVDIHTILDYKMLCLKPEYIAEFLMRHPEPDPHSYRYKGAKEIRNLEENNSKLDLRKCKTSTNTDSPSKKTRLR